VPLPDNRQTGAVRFTVGLRRIGKGNGSDLSMNVSMGKVDSCFFADLSCPDPSHCSAEYFGGDQDALCVKISRRLKVINDVRIKFYCSSSSVPKGYEHCAFYFWYA
jgi:PTEN phosphatase family protein